MTQMDMSHIVDAYEVRLVRRSGLWGTGELEG